MLGLTWASRLAGRFAGYNTRKIEAADTTDRRRNAGSRTVSLDYALNEQRRGRLQASTNYVADNFAVAAWAIRRHLDYVTRFNFQCRSGDKGLDRAIEDFVATWSQKKNCDVAQRHSLARLIRLAECQRVIGGDVVFARFGPGTYYGKLQGIEADRIRTPKDEKKAGKLEAWRNGVKVGPGGAARWYGVHKRTSSGAYELERLLNASNAYHVGYFNGFDQWRGVSPLATAINPLQDVYEAFDKTLAKIKLAEAIALVLFRDLEGDDEEDDVATVGNATGPTFGNGPSLFDLDRDDKAEILESKTPSTNTAQFWETMLGVSLKALDIPFSFYDESFTNFFGSRAAWQHYETSAKSKRRDLLDDLLTPVTYWRLGMAFAFDELLEPSNRTLASLNFRWLPAGTPWWRPLEDVTASVMAIDNGLKTRSEVRAETYGDDWYDVADELARERQHLAQLAEEYNLPAAAVDPTAAELSAGWRKQQLLTSIEEATDELKTEEE